MRAYRVAYDGREYHGFQRQPSVSTVEGVLLAALARLGVTEDEDVPPGGYAAAGRTDAGVSALAQTIAFEAPEWLDPSAFNSQLPAEVRVWASTPVSADFHATHDATAREYEYQLYAPAADVHVARTAMERLAGQQDVANLTLDDDGTDRTLDPSLTVDGSFLLVRFRAGGFPRQFVRRAVELVRAVATGERSLDAVDRVLDPTPLSGPEGVPPAPPDPLVLLDVRYPGRSFAVDQRAVETARAIFEEKRSARLASARVAGRIASELSQTDA
jgi:tRNA pseudouridine38-40 synthase